MNRDDYDAASCSVGYALSAIGEKWTLLVIREAFFGVRRFDQMQGNLEYRLTRKGLDLYPALVSLMSWGDAHQADEAGAPITLVHKGCGHEASPVLACGHCGRALDAREVRIEPGPGARRIDAA